MLVGDDSSLPMTTFSNNTHAHTHQTINFLFPFAPPLPPWVADGFGGEVGKEAWGEGSECVPHVVGRCFDGAFGDGLVTNTALSKGKWLVPRG